MPRASQSKAARPEPKSAGAARPRSAPSSSLPSTSASAHDLSKLRELVIGLGVQRVADILFEQGQHLQAKVGSDRSGRQVRASGIKAKTAPVPRKSQDSKKSTSANSTEGALTNINELRKFRGDVISHYPFVDSAGSVASLLKARPEREPATAESAGEEADGGARNPMRAELSVLDVPAPQGRRMMRRAFDEFRVGRDSLRVADIPLALQSIGLVAPSNLSNSLFSGADGREGPIEGEATSPFPSAASVGAVSVPAYVSFDQWLHVVYHAARSRIAEGVVSTSATSDDDGGVEAGAASSDHGSEGRAERLYQEEYDDECETRSPNAHAKYSYEMTRRSSEESRSGGSAPRGTSGGKRTSKASTSDKRVVQPAQRSPLQRLIAADKARFFSEKKKYNAAAARKIAESRLDRVTAQKRGQDPEADERAESAGSRRVIAYDEQEHEREFARLKQDYKLRPFYWREEEAIDRRSEGQTDGRRDSRNSREPPAARHDVSTDDDFLHSGRAALEIASSFLDSELCHQLLHNSNTRNSSRGVSTPSSDSEGDEEEEVLQDRKQQRLVNLFEDLKPFTHPVSRGSVQAPPRRDTDAGAGDAQPSSSSSSSASFTDEGWRKTRGGWVGDFGPLHTHTLSVQEARNKAFIPRSKPSVSSASRANSIAIANSNVNAPPSSSTDPQPASKSESVSLNDYILHNS